MIVSGAHLAKKVKNETTDEKIALMAVLGDISGKHVSWDETDGTALTAHGSNELSVREISVLSISDSTLPISEVD